MMRKGKIMKITVITPCFNPGKYLLPMLESVAAQGGVVAQHIVMDGGSTDGSVQVLKDWATAHPYFRFVSEKDKGQSDASQKALNLVNTEYFCWLNADDKLLEGALDVLCDKVASCKYKPAIVYGDYIRIDGDDKVIAERRQPSYNYWDCLHGYLFVQNAAAIFNADMLKASGGYDTSLRFVMDYDIILKLAKQGRVVHVPRFCGAFRIHATSKTTTIDDVCQEETQLLRTRYGVTTNRVLRKLLECIVKLRVAIRMVFQGCMKGRLY